jgi:flagellar biosynthesis GTPase FlhF
MKSRQLRWMTIASLLTVGLISCSDPSAQCQQLSKKAISTDGRVTGIQSAMGSDAGVLAIQGQLKGNAELGVASFEKTIQEVESLSISDPDVKGLQTRYVANLQEIFQAAKDLADPAKQKAARQIIAQKVPESKQIYKEIRDTCTAKL